MKPKLLLLMLLCCHGQLQAKEIALTFDDAPREAAGYFDGQTRAKTLIQALQRHDVGQVAFFCVTQRLDTEGELRLQAYGEAGHILANHSHSHPDFNRTGLQDYIQDFERADAKLSQFDQFRKLYRFPYLREGDTAKKRDGMRARLNERGYINAYITLNNYDWYIETLFQQAIEAGVTLDIERLRRFYVQVMLESIEYYDQMALNHLSVPPKHVLLLHEMDITALFIGDLVDALRQRGWKIISPLEAYAANVELAHSERLFRFNPGRIGEIARDRGQTQGLWHHSLDEAYLDQRFAKEVLAPEPVKRVPM